MDLFKGICLFLKIFVVTLLRITKNEGHRALRHPSQTFITRLASTPKSQGKDSETRPISDGFRKNNVNYWAFREIRSIIPHL